MAEVASAYISLMPSFKGGAAVISRELDGPLGRASAASGKTSGNKFLGGFGSSLKVGSAKMFAPLAAAAAGVALVGFFKSAVTAASDLAETTSKVGVLFGDSATAIQGFADTAAKSFGLSRQAALDANATFATFAKSAGLQGTALTGFTTELTGLAADLASFSNTSPEQAIQAIGSALRGEMEPIRAYGVLLDDATLRQEALKLGLIKTTKDALTPQQKVLAAQAAILAQTSAAQGDFARTAGGLANKQKILKAELANLTAEAGTKLLPVMLKATGLFIKLTDFVTRNKDAIVPVISVLGGLAAGLLAVTVGTAAWNAVLALNPIGLVVVGLAALAAGLIYAYNHFEGFRRVVDATFSFLRDNWKLILGILIGPIGAAVVIIVQHWNTIKAGVTGVKDWIVTSFNEVVGFITGLPGRITSAASGMFDGIKDAFRSAINWIIDKWNGLDFSIPGVDTHIPGVGTIGGFTLGTPDIPRLASGGLLGSAGTVIVGERGAELLTLPKAARVTPLSRGVAGATAGSGVVINIDTVQAHDYADFMRQMAQRARVGARR